MDKRNITKFKKSLRDGIEKIGTFYSSGSGIQKKHMSVWDLEQETLDSYAAVFKKVLSGTKEKNLFEIGVDADRQDGFSKDSIDQVMEVMADKAPLEGRFVVMAAAVTGDENACIYCICPAVEVRPGLAYDEKQKLFVDRSLGWAAKAPVMGFMYPCLEEEGADLNKAILFASKKEYMADDLLTELFGAGSVMTGEEQKRAFKALVEESLGRDCSFDRVADILEQVGDAGRALMEKGEDDGLGSAELDRIIKDPDSKAFRERFDDAVGHAGTLSADCICDKGRMTVISDAGKLVSEGEQAQLLRTEVIDGIEYLLVPLSGDVTVNGIRVLKKRDV